MLTLDTWACILSVLLGAAMMVVSIGFEKQGKPKYAADTIGMAGVLLMVLGVFMALQATGNA